MAVLVQGIGDDGRWDWAQVLQREDPATEELPDLSLEVVCLEWAVEKLRQQGQAARQLALLLEEATVASPVSADKRTLADIDAALRARGIQCAVLLPSLRVCAWMSVSVVCPCDCVCCVCV